MIEVRNLSKNYGAKNALSGISFTAEDGGVLGFLGPNGAGKSTTMNILTGYISPSGGTALIDGIDIQAEPNEAKKNIGYLPEIPPLYPDMTVDEYLSFVYGLKKCKFPKKSHLDEICGLTKIDDVRRRVIRNLSKGYKQRVGLAQALVGNPKTLILDEPTVGLDPKQIIEIRELVKKLGKRHTVILSSHILSEVQAVCDKIVVISGGKLVADDTEENLSRKFAAGRRVIVQLEGEPAEAEKLLKSVAGVEKIRSSKTAEQNVTEFELDIKEGCDVRRGIFKKASERNFPILLMRSGELSLEEIFLKLTAGDLIGGDGNDGNS